MKFLSVHGPRTKIYWHLVLVTLQLAYGIFRYKIYNIISRDIISYFRAEVPKQVNTWFCLIRGEKATMKLLLIKMLPV